MTNKLSECINIAQSVSHENNTSHVATTTSLKPLEKSTDDIFTHLDRIDNTLLDCIKLSEDTLRATEHDSLEAKFNQDFDDFMSSLEQLPTGKNISSNDDHHNKVRDQDLADYIYKQSRSPGQLG